MNERIRLLAEQARLYAEEQYPGSFVKYDPKWFEFYNEKFAELIVRECAHVGFNAAYPYKGVEVLIAIKKHFGVDE